MVGAVSVSSQTSLPKLSPQGMASLLAAAAVVVHREEKAQKEQLRPSEDRFRRRPDEGDSKRTRASRFLGQAAESERTTVSEARAEGPSGRDKNTMQDEIRGRMVSWNLEKQRRAR